MRSMSYILFGKPTCFADCIDQARGHRLVSVEDRKERVIRISRKGYFSHRVARECIGRVNDAVVRGIPGSRLIHLVRVKDCYHVLPERGSLAATEIDKVRSGL